MTPDDQTLLVVEDEPFLRTAVAQSLRFLGFQVTAEQNGTDAPRLARAAGLTCLSLTSSCRTSTGSRSSADAQRREPGSGDLLTAEDARDGKITGLSIGGDDYLTKPFDLEELVARVRTVLRCTRPAAPWPVLSFADLTLNQDSYEVHRGGRLIELSPTEFRLLCYFMLNPDRVLTHASCSLRRLHHRRGLPRGHLHPGRAGRPGGRLGRGVRRLLRRRPAVHLRVEPGLTWVHPCSDAITPPGVYRGPMPDGQITEERGLNPGDGPSLAIFGLRWIAVPVGVAAVIVSIAGVVPALPAEPPGVIAAAAIALLAGICGVAIVVYRPTKPLAVDLTALVVTSLAGVVLAGLLPDTPGIVLVYIAMAGLAMRAPLPLAAALGLVVFGTVNLAYLLAGKLSVADLASQDLGVVFVFAIGAFTRSARSAQEHARQAQATAEGLLVQLRASQAAQAQAAALTERARLAREIHDILAHSLSGLVLALDTMELLGRQPDPGRATMNRMMEQVSRCQRIARDGLADTRRAIAALRGDGLPGPALLDRLVRDTAASTGVRAELSVTGTERPLSAEVGLAVYRTAQEALTNTAKYAGRDAAAALRLTYDSDGVELVVEDARPAGRPDVTAGLTFGGYGLTGMRERAELLGGSLTAGPTETGFAVWLRLPAPAAVPPSQAESGAEGGDGAASAGQASAGAAVGGLAS
jgi:signal transduction histidine kinase/DNA-binding response OmpR family regulator